MPTPNDWQTVEHPAINDWQNVAPQQRASNPLDDQNFLDAVTSQQFAALPWEKRRAKLIENVPDFAASSQADQNNILGMIQKKAAMLATPAGKYKQITDLTGKMVANGEMTPDEQFEVHKALSQKGYGPGAPAPPQPAGLAPPRPDAPALPSMMGIDLGAALGPIGDYAKAGWDRMTGGIAHAAQPSTKADPHPTLRGINDAIQGAGQAVAPMALPLAPLAGAARLGAGLAGGYAGGKLVRGVVGLLNGGQEAQDLGETTGNLVGGAAAATSRGMGLLRQGIPDAVAHPLDALESWATRHTNPVPTVVKAIKPRAVKTNFKDALTAAMPEIKAAEPQLGRSIGGRYQDPNVQPGHAIEDTLVATKIAKAKLGQFIGSNVQSNGGLKIDLSPLGQAEADAIPQHIKTENPAMAAQMAKDAAAKWQGKSVGLQEADKLLHDYNAQKDAFYAKYPPDQRAALRANPEAAKLEANVSALRDQIYGTLEQKTGTNAQQDAMRKYGNLMEVERELYPRLNVATRQNPDSLSEQVGKWTGAAKVAKGLLTMPVNPVGGAASVAEGVASSKAAAIIKDANTSDTLLRRAFANYSGDPSLADQLSRALPPAPDTSGPLPQGIADFRSVGSPAAPRPLLQLPAPATPLGVSGTTVPDILGNTARGKGGPVGLLSAPAPGRPPLNILPTGPGAIGPAGTVPQFSSETPKPMPEQMSGLLGPEARQRQPNGGWVVGSDGGLVWARGLLNLR